MVVARRPAQPGTLDALAALEEADVVARARAADLQAFEFLVTAYRPRLQRLAFRMLGDAGEAEDVVQETLAAGWRALPGLDSTRSFGGWIHRMTVNRCLDVLRRRSAHPEEMLDALGVGVLPAGEVRPEADPHRSAETAAELRALAAALRGLPEDLRSCWLLRELDGKSYRQIGTALQISEPMVRGRLARAREKLAEAMIAWR